MRRALVLLLLVAFAAFADEETKLPFNPWEKAAAGDWETLKSEVKWDKKDKGSPPIPEVVTYVIRGADEKEVKLGMETIPASGEERVSVVYPKGETPSFEKLLALSGKLEGYKSAEDKKKIGDKEIACTRVSFKGKTQSTKLQASNTLWFSKDVKGLGIVEQVVEGGGATVTYRLVGYGAKDKVEWGKKASELEKK